MAKICVIELVFYSYLEIGFPHMNSNQSSGEIDKLLVYYSPEVKDHHIKPSCNYSFESSPNPINVQQMKIQTKEKPLNITNINFMYDENTWKRIRNEDIKHKLDSLLLNII